MEDINYSQSDLQKMNMRELRKLAGKLNLKRYQSLRKHVLIEKLLVKQGEVESALSELSQPSNLNSDLSDLQLEESSFSNFITRYSYIPTDLSEVSEIC